MKGFLPMVALLGIMVMVAGCEGDEGGCSVDSDCKADQVCVGGVYCGYHRAEDAGVQPPEQDSTQPPPPPDANLAPVDGAVELDAVTPPSHDASVPPPPPTPDANVPPTPQDAAVPPAAPPGPICNLATEYKVPTLVNFRAGFPTVGRSAFWFNPDGNTAHACIGLLNGDRPCYNDRVVAYMNEHNLAGTPFPAKIYESHTHTYLSYSYDSIGGETRLSALYLEDSGAWSGVGGIKRVAQLWWTEGPTGTVYYKSWQNGALSAERPLRVARDDNGFVYWAAPDDGPGEVLITYQCVPKPEDAGVPDGGVIDAGPPPDNCVNMTFTSLNSSNEYPGLAPDISANTATNRGQVCLEGNCFGGDVTSLNGKAMSFASDNGNIMASFGYMPGGQLDSVSVTENGALYGSPRQIFSLTFINGAPTIRDFVYPDYQGPASSVEREGTTRATIRGNWPGTITLTAACVQ